MKHSAQDAFNALSNDLAKWVDDITGASFTESQIAPLTKTDAQVCLLPIGWTPEMAQGRHPKERRIIADYVVTASAKTPAKAAGMLGDLLVNPSPAIKSLMPLSPDTSLWSLLDTPPQPALLASCPVMLSAPEVLAPPISDVLATFGPSNPLSGHVKSDGKPVADAIVSIKGADRNVRTDASGFFTIGGWCGQTIEVTHRGEIQSFTPDPGSKDLILSITKEN